MADRELDSTTEHILTEIKTLHECLDGLREENREAHIKTQKEFSELKDEFVVLRDEVSANHAELKQYFVGVDASQHVKDHFIIENNRHDEEGRRDVRNNIISGIVTALILSLGGWLVVNALNAHEDRQRAEILEQIRKGGIPSIPEILVEPKKK
jgi:hypothetical protein